MTGTATSTNMPKSVIDDWTKIDRFVATIRAPRAPTNLVAADVTAGRTLFINNNCAACHGGSNWTISKVFYSPGDNHNGTLATGVGLGTGGVADPIGDLRTLTYMLPAGFPMSNLNPPANAGAATLRLNDIMAIAANDQINCVLRNVGTMPAIMGTTPPAGITVANAPRLLEARTNMTTPAQGATGFNPPSLFGMATGAPYFHGGNARTLEELFDTVFQAHFTAHSAIFAPTATEKGQLAQFLMSIDESTTMVAPQGGLGFNPDLCPTLP
jgi:hypothetical protein